MSNAPIVTVQSVEHRSHSDAQRQRRRIDHRQSHRNSTGVALEQHSSGRHLTTTDVALLHVRCRLGQCGNQVGGAFFEQLAQQLLAPAAPPAAGSRSASQQPAPLQPVPLWQQDAFQRGIYSRFFRPPTSRRSTAALGADPDAAASAASTAGVGSAPLPVARAVLVDMEPKVIQQALSAAGRSSCYQYDERRSFYRQSGSGNNCQ